MRHLTLAGTLAVLAACSADAALDATRNLDTSPEPVDSVEGAFDEPLAVRIDVYPADMSTGPSPDAPFRTLPKSSPRLIVDGSQDVDAGTLQLDTPIRFTGRIQGFRLNPQVALLPGQTVPVPSTVRLSLADTVQDYIVSTDEDGRFGAWVAPRAVYSLTVQPSDPGFPVVADTLPITDSARDIELNLPFAVPVYGRVGTSAGPIEGAEVYLVNAEGERTAAAVSAADGWYTVRTLPGTYDVVCDGGNPVERPVITHHEVVVDDLGAYVDFDYIDIEPVLVRGFVVPAVDVPLRGAEVRFASKNLIGYDGVDARWSFDALLQPEDQYLVYVLPGSYDIEVIPPRREADALGDPFFQAAAPDLSPTQLRDVVVINTKELDDVVLPESAFVLGSVTDRDGAAVEATQVECTEVGFGRRQWSIMTDVFGAFQIQLPQVPMRCIVTPPGDSGLASRAFSFVPGEREGPTVVLYEGVALSGRVRGPDGQPETFATAVVRREGDGLILATGLTDGDGRYEVRVAP